MSRSIVHLTKGGVGTATRRSEATRGAQWMNKTQGGEQQGRQRIFVEIDRETYTKDSRAFIGIRESFCTQCDVTGWAAV